MSSNTMSILTYLEKINGQKGHSKPQPGVDVKTTVEGFVLKPKGKTDQSGPLPGSVNESSSEDLSARVPHVLDSINLDGIPCLAPSDSYGRTQAFSSVILSASPKPAPPKPSNKISAERIASITQRQQPSPSQNVREEPDMHDTLQKAVVYATRLREERERRGLPIPESTACGKCCIL